MLDAEVKRRLLRLLAGLMFFAAVNVLIGGVSVLVFNSCPDRAAATTDSCIDPHIDEVYEWIFLFRLEQLSAT